MVVFKIKIGRIALFAAALFAVPAMATTYWLDNSVAASGEGLTKETAFKSWNEAWEVIAAISDQSGNVLNVVASENAYLVTAMPSTLKGLRNVGVVRGVNADGTDVADPASVVIDGQGLYQIAPCGTSVDLTISGLTFKNAYATDGSGIGTTGTGGAIDLKEFNHATQTGGNVVSNCVFAGCSGCAALVVVGSSNTVTHCVFRGNASTFASSLEMRKGSKRTDLPSYVRNCRFENNDSSAAEPLTTDQARGNALFAHGVLEISDCTFRANIGAANGAAAYLYGGLATTLSGCNFLSNTNTYSGAYNYGGVVVSNYGSGEGPVFRNCTFSDNVCENAYGAFMRGGNESDPVSFYDCTFSGNKAKYGAAIALVTGNRTLLASNCTFTANSASSDGVVYRGVNSNAARYRVDLVDCVFAANGGNSVLVHAAGNTTVSFTNALVRCVFAGNSTSSHIIDCANGIFTAESCVFTNNAMTAGTVLYCGNKNPGAGTTNYLANCLFARNTTGESSTQPCALNMLYGGADNCTFADNTALNPTPKNGAVWSLGRPETVLRNCIFSGNSNNNKWNKYTCLLNSFVDFSNANLDASNIGKSASAEPGFKDATNGDYALAKNSVCRNAGDNTVWAGIAGANDLAGKARINADDGNVVDVGCYEWYSSKLPGMTIFVR